jgi:hypothetical protein
MSNEEYENLSKILAQGDITTSSKKELERYLVLLSRPGASVHISGNLYQQACESVRLLLTVRISEEVNNQARKDSRIALVIACVALVVSIVQAFK